MELAELVRATRSFRRFKEDTPLHQPTLDALIELARLGGSARNVQPLRYVTVLSEDKRAQIFPHLGWAGYLSDWPGPKKGERPAAYIICLADTSISNDPDHDLGIASQNILLGATAEGIGGCRIASFSKALYKEFNLSENMKILMVIALGIPAEQIELVNITPADDIKYWRDRNDVHHVPKRKLEDLIISKL